MTEPVRLRLSRQAGFNLQAHSLNVNWLPAVSVARPSRWGNPFIIGKTLCIGSPQTQFIDIDSNAIAVNAFRKMLECTDRNYPTDAAIRAALRGKNLACWCVPDAPCHADVLLEIANKKIEG